MRPDCTDQDVIDNATERGVIVGPYAVIPSKYPSNLRDYRPERPDRYEMETVASMMYETDAHLLMKYARIAEDRFSVDDHVILDIGTFHGASAIIMAKASNFNVITLDPYPGPDIQRSFRHHGVSDRIEAVTIKSEDYIWDPTIQIPLMMIDGLHYLSQVKFEFYYFGQFVPTGGFVAFHDVGKAKWTGICDVINEAITTPHWRIADLEGYMCVLERL